MTTVKVFQPHSDLPFDIATSDNAQVENESPQYYLARVLAGIGQMVAGQGTGTRVVCPVTFSLDTSAYAAGDLLADTQAITGAARTSAGTTRLEQITLLDKDDNTAAIVDVVFLRSNTSIGTENDAPSPSDTAAEEILGIVSIAAADFVDVGGAKVATKILSTPLDLKPATGTSIYVALIARGTPTQTASGLVGQFFFRQD